MKHLIEPTFALEYIPQIGNADRVLTLADSSDFVMGGSTRLTYGINNRLLYRGARPPTARPARPSSS